MLEEYTRYYQLSTGRSLPRYTQYKHNLNLFVIRVFERFRRAYGFETTAVAMLRQILSNVDYEWMLRTNNDIDSYQGHVRFIKPTLDNIFDPVMSGRSFTNMFFSKRLGKIEEYICPTEDINTLVTLPFGKDWNHWERVTPIKLWWHDSTEFSLNIMHDRVNFVQMAPTHAVLTIDTTALAYKYYYWKYKGGYQDDNREPEDATQQVFIHKHVICPLIYDLVNIWSLQQFRQVLVSTSLGEEDTTQYMDINKDSQYGQVGLLYQSGIRGLATELEFVKRGAVLPITLINSPILFTETLQHRCTQTQHRWAISGLRQYEHIRVMRDIELVEGLAHLYQCNPTHPATKNFYRDLRIDTKRLLQRRPWTHCANRKIAAIVEERIYAFQTSFLL